MQVALVVFPGYTALDALGPYQVLAHTPGIDPVFVAERPGPVRDNRVLTIEAQAGLGDVPAPDVVLVAGGIPAITMARTGHPIVDWLRDVRPTAQWVTSVCTGALMLGAAGILQGRRATTHWYAHDMLRDYGAVPVDERVVVDGDVVTAAGVSAGIDMGLRLAALWAGEPTAKMLQLDLEYAPRPPFDCGSPATADAEITDHLREMYDAVLAGLLPADRE